MQTIGCVCAMVPSSFPLVRQVSFTLAIVVSFSISYMHTHSCLQLFNKYKSCLYSSTAVVYRSSINRQDWYDNTNMYYTNTGTSYSFSFFVSLTLAKNNWTKKLVQFANSKKAVSGLQWKLCLLINKKSTHCNAHAGVLTNRSECILFTKGIKCNCKRKPKHG